MKRSDLVAGETYAVMSPGADPRQRYVGEVKKVTVIDPDALAAKRDSWGHRYQDDAELSGTIELANGQELDVTGDYSRLYLSKPSYTSVGAWVVRHETLGFGPHASLRNYLTAVPLSQIRMTWAEYSAIREQVSARVAEERQVREDREREQDRLKKMAAAMEKALNDSVKVSGVKAICSARSDGSISTKLELNSEQAASCIAFLNERPGR